MGLTKTTSVHLAILLWKSQSILKVHLNAEIRNHFYQWSVYEHERYTLRIKLEKRFECLSYGHKFHPLLTRWRSHLLLFERKEKKNTSFSYQYINNLNWISVWSLQNENSNKIWFHSIYWLNTPLFLLHAIDFAAPVKMVRFRDWND